MRALNFACIGGWHIHTERFIAKVNEYPDCRVSVIWDPDKERGTERAQRYHCEYAETYEEVLKDSTISGVLITSATREHFQQIKKALLAGKHVFVEKPPFYTVEEAVEIQKLLKKTGLKFLVSDPIRSVIRQLYCARKIMESGRIGKITTIRVRCAMQKALVTDHIESFNPALTGGGMMFDVGCHAVHMLCILAGKANKVNAVFTGTSAAAREYGVDDNEVAVYEFDEGVIGIAETSALAERREDFFLVSGTHGSILCIDKEFRFRSDGSDWIRVEPDEWPLEKAYPLYRWIDAIEENEPVEDCGIEDAIQFTQMITGAYVASRYGVDIKTKS